MTIQFTPIQNDVGRRTIAELSISGIEFPDLDTVRPLLRFPIGSYNKISAKGETTDAWNGNFRPLNELLATLTPSEQIYLAKAFALMHFRIDEYVKMGNLQEFDDFIQELGDMLIGIDEELNLQAKLHQFVLNNIPIKDMSEVGTRVQDSPEYTFRQEETRHLQTLAMLCKFMSPIFGVVMENSKAAGPNKKDKKYGPQELLRTDLDPGIKETYCAAILTKWINKHYHALYLKLDGYIRHTIRNFIKPKDMGMFYGVTENSHTLTTLSNLFTRNFVNVDLYDLKSNLPTYIFSSARNTIDTKRNDMISCKVMPRTGGDGGAAKDESVKAQIEVDGLVSEAPGDVEMIVMAALPLVVAKYAKIFEIPEAEIREAHSFYLRNPFPATIYNQVYTCMFFGPDLAGARSVLQLAFPDYSLLVTVLQLILYKLKYPASATYLTARVAATPKAVRTMEDNHLITSYSTTSAYAALLAKFNYSVVGSTAQRLVNQYMEAMALSVANYTHYAHLPAFLCERQPGMDTGLILDSAAGLVREFCEVYEAHEGMVPQVAQPA